MAESMTTLCSFDTMVTFRGRFPGFCLIIVYKFSSTSKSCESLTAKFIGSGGASCTSFFTFLVSLFASLSAIIFVTLRRGPKSVSVTLALNATGSSKFICESCSNLSEKSIISIFP